MFSSAEQSVCVIIAAHNAAATVGRAVRSALDQAEASEVVLIDDASNDDTVEVALAHAAGSDRLRILRLDKNAGPSAARNIGLASTKADFVTPLDADDYMLPGRLAKILGAIGDADFIADEPLWQTEGSSEVLPSELLGVAVGESARLSLREFVERNISRAGKSRRELGFLKPLIRRTFLVDHGLAYDEALRLGEDYALYASSLAAGGKFLLMSTCGYVAVHRANSLSSRHSAQDLQALYDFDIRFLATHDLAGAEQETLKRHSRSIWLKIQHRHVLDDKAAGRYFKLAGRLAGSLSTLTYVVSQTFQDKRRARAFG